ncbi:hypothetical protein A4X13_0g7513 [Tilletia indica]|uniref:Uncharacterized protein n=1 Tax=Tilletia indica TaxID=43049 RepID=A0A177TDB5_9BASI|nr:hypothetical protein A4X13_0g7513 [Tilletia indica]
MQFSFALIAMAALGAGQATAAVTQSGYTGTYTTSTSCTPRYGTKSVSPPIPTYSTFNSTKGFAQKTTSVVATVNYTPTPRPTITKTKTVTNTLVVNGATTITSTVTATSTRASASSTVTVPTPAGFRPINPRYVGRRTLHARATSYVTATYCTSQVVFVPSQTKTVTYSTSTRTVATRTLTTAITKTATSYATTKTATKTTTKVVLPTVYAMCEGGANMGTSYPGPDDRPLPINYFDANDDIFWNESHNEATDSRSCCTACAKDELCIGSAWVNSTRLLDDFNVYSKCTIFKSLLDCPFDEYPLPYGYDDKRPSVKQGQIVLSNGGCGPGFSLDLR